MPRKSRKFSSTNFFHIMVQGINKEYIFSRYIDKEKYFSLINDKIRDYNIFLISYCIMDNHTHLLLHCKNISEISKFMSRINTSYGKWYNSQQSRVGYVFRDRYLSQPILNYSHLYNCIFYIHNNPVNAHLVHMPNDYQYSSYNDYIQKSGIYNSKLLDLLLLSENNYLSILTKVHAPISLKEDSLTPISSESIINEYLKLKNIKKKNLLTDTNTLKEIINQLRTQYNLSIVDISKFFRITRSKIYRMLK